MEIMKLYRFFSLHVLVDKGAILMSIMRRGVYLIIVVGIFLITHLFVSCSSRETNNTVSLNMDSGFTKERVDVVTNQPIEEVQDSKLPDIIELNYKEVEPESIWQAGDLTLLKKVKIEQMGKVDDEQINIGLYSDKDNSIHGVFRHKGKEYILNYLGYATDLDLVDIHKLQIVYNTNGKNTVLVSGIGSSILGYQYIFFDESNNKWIYFHNWGTPKVFDINQDGIKEVFLQFHGLHLNRPDLNIFSFQGGRLMVAEVNSEVYRNAKLDINKNWIVSKYIKEQDDKAFVEISDISRNEAPLLYHLEYDKQNSFLLRLRKDIQIKPAL